MKIIKANRVNFPLWKSPTVDAWLACVSNESTDIYHVDAFAVTDEAVVAHAIEMINEDGDLVTGIDVDIIQDFVGMEFWLSDSRKDLKDEVEAYYKQIAGINAEAMKHLDDFCLLIDKHPEAALSEEQRHILNSKSMYHYLRYVMK